MHDDLLLQLHCPKCATIVDVVTEGNNLVCLECGWKFDERVAAKFLDRAALPPAEALPAAK
jgi:hypothetical protein